MLPVFSIVHVSTDKIHQLQLCGYGMFESWYERHRVVCRLYSNRVEIIHYIDVTMTLHAKNSRM